MSTPRLSGQVWVFCVCLCSQRCYTVSQLRATQHYCETVAEYSNFLMSGSVIVRISYQLAFQFPTYIFFPIVDFLPSIFCFSQGFVMFTWSVTSIRPAEQAWSGQSWQCGTTKIDADKAPEKLCRHLTCCIVIQLGRSLFCRSQSVAYLAVRTQYSMCCCIRRSVGMCTHHCVSVFLVMGEKSF